MRLFLPNIITPEEADALASFQSTKKDEAEEHTVFKKIRGVIDSHIPTDWSSPSYSRVEKAVSHNWHVDTGGEKGSKGHMSWCSYGCSVLLTNTKDAGYLEYRDGKKLLPEEHYCGLAIHSSDVEHRTSQDGGRITFISFTK